MIEAKDYIEISYVTSMKPEGMARICDRKEGESVLFPNMIEIYTENKNLYISF